ncbi:hypothetical protein HDU96_010462 [Phlyctochytrium bullatum]|nr:hypothetical protein HDU96_010462 [Phlyctochytrium bullatum]
MSIGALRLFHAQTEACSMLKYWNGSNVSSLTPNAEKKIMEFYSSSILADMDVIGFAYRPLGHFSDLSNLLSKLKFSDRVIKDIEALDLQQVASKVLFI